MTTPKPGSLEWHKTLQDNLRAVQTLLWEKVNQGEYRDFDQAQRTLTALAAVRKALKEADELAQLPLPETNPY